MNRGLLATGIVCFLLASVFVPYKIDFRSTMAEVVGTSGETITSYHFIGQAPERGFVGDEESPTGDSGTIQSVGINTGRLVIQYAIIIAIFGGGALLAGTSSSDESDQVSP